MISDYFKAPWVLARMRSGSVGPYVDGLAATLAGAGFGARAIRVHIRAAVHFRRWADEHGIAIAAFDDGSLSRFRRRLRRCRYIKRSKGTLGGAVSGARRGTRFPAAVKASDGLRRHHDYVEQWRRLFPSGEATMPSNSA